jgi:hypothetical protein
MDENQVVQPQPKAPKCPGCSTQPLRFSQNIMTTTNGAAVSMIWCADCGHTLEVKFLGMPAPQIARPDLRIVKPS